MVKKVDGSKPMSQACIFEKIEIKDYMKLKNSILV